VRTYVFDAGALLALLLNKPGASRVNEITKEAVHGRSRILMSTVNYGEVYGLLLRHQHESTARRILSAVGRLPIELHDATPQRSLRAAELKITYKLYYIDAFAAALALEHKATLVTSDSDFRKLGHNFAMLLLKN
jgi:predicted nucleic acid-binding protein